MTTRYVDRHGRLRSDKRFPATPTLSPLRLGVVLCLLLYLYASVPRPIDPWRQRRSTDYGLFSVWDRTTKLQFHVAGTTLECDYSSFGEDTATTNISPHTQQYVCQVLKEQLCHEKGLFWEKDDPVYTLHRLVAWTTVLVSILTACCTDPIQWTSGNAFVDSWMNVWWDPSTQDHPLSTIIYKLWTLNTIVYPALEFMYDAMELQGRTGFFGRIFVQSLPNRFFFSVACLWILALLVNTAATHLYRPMGWDSLLSVALGYSAQFRSMNYSALRLSWDVTTWAILAVYCLRRPFFYTLSLLLGFFCGQFLGMYHIAHMNYSMLDMQSYSYYFGAVGRWFSKLKGTVPNNFHV